MHTLNISQNFRFTAYKILILTPNQVCFLPSARGVLAEDGDLPTLSARAPCPGAPQAHRVLRGAH